MIIWEIISIPLTIVLFIVSTILLIKLTKRKRPVWALNTKQVIGLGAEAPPEIKLYFSNKQINDVYQTTFIFFNSGNETILRNDVTENVTIHFKDAEILRQPTINKMSKDAIKFSAKQVIKGGDNCIELDFLYLDNKDGAVVEVLHAASKGITCSGNIIDSKQVVNIGHFSQSLPHRLFRGVLGFIRLMFALTILLSGLGILLYGAFTSTLTDFTLTRLFVPVILILAGLTYIPDIISYFQYRKFPRWSFVAA